MAYLGGFGSNATKTVGATLAITASSTIPAGTLLVLGISWDNIDAATPTISSVSTSGGGTWTSRGTGNVGVSATAGSGIFAAVYTTLTTSSISSGATITTITFSSASTASKAAAIVGFDEMIENLRGSVVSATSTGGAPSAVTTTAPVTGDVVIGVIHGEDNATPTGDADTLNGSWSALYGTASTGAGAATNMAIGIQAKTVTAGGNQTFNATTANDAVAFVFTLATPIPATLSGQSTSGGSGVVTATYKPDIVGQSTSSGSLPSMSAVNTFVLTAQSNSSGSLAAGVRFPTSASGQSNSSGTGQIRTTIRSTLSGQSTTAGSLAAFRAQGIAASGMSMSAGAATVTATRRPTMIGQATSAGTFAPIVAFRPTATGQSNATGSLKVGIDSPGSMNATALTYGAVKVGIVSPSALDGQSNSAGQAAATFSLSDIFIGWGSPI